MKKDKIFEKVAKELEDINEKLGRDVKIVQKRESKIYDIFVALVFLFGFCLLSIGISIHQGWNQIISSGIMLISVGIFAIWVASVFE